MYKPGIVFNNVADFMPKLVLSYEFYDVPDGDKSSDTFVAEANFTNDYNAGIKYRTYNNVYDWSNNQISDPGYKIEVAKVLSMLPYKPKLFVNYLYNWYKQDYYKYSMDGDFASGFQIKLEYDIK